MQLSAKGITIIVVSLLVIIFLISVRSILTPFILAAVFAYILNPAVLFLKDKTHLPRRVSVVIIYTIVVAILIVLAANLGIRLTKESKELGYELRFLNKTIDTQLDSVPEWALPIITDVANSISFGSIFAPGKIWPYFSGAISGLISFFIFLVASFYFLQSGAQWMEFFQKTISVKNKIDIAILFKKINQVLGDYLRGQVFLIILMSTVSWLALSLLQVRYSLIIGIFTGVMEIVPIIGPIVAGTVAVLVAVFDGVTSFGLPPLFQGLVVAALYFLLRQTEDIFVIPHVLGHATKLHPLVVLFAVLAGGHLWGILGMILAIPVAALFRIVFDFYLSKIA
ncbi:MAG: AI-2E family transporter [Patescibacteria group bacterium]|nr:AI-2E family transporter [Patescibacteria group bacterium]